MRNIVKNSFYATAGLVLIGLNTANVSAAAGAALFGQGDDRISGSSDTIDVVIKGWMAYLVGFLYLIAIIMMIYGGFNILTAAGDEEKVKKGKTILMQAIGGLIVVFIANSVIGWIMTGLFGNAA